MTVAGIVLAAGASSRAGFPKALARIGETRFIEHAVGMLAGLWPIVVVVAPPHGHAIRRCLRGRELSFAENDDASRGMLSSLQAGIRALDLGTKAALVALVDHPSVRRTTVTALLDGWQKSRAALVRPTFLGRGGHPLLLAREGFASVLAADPSSSTRDVLMRLAPRLDLEIGDAAIREDLDTSEAIARVCALSLQMEHAHHADLGVVEDVAVEHPHSRSIVVVDEQS